MNCKNKPEEECVYPYCDCFRDSGSVPSDPCPCPPYNKGLYLTDPSPDRTELADDISFVRCDRGAPTEVVLPSFLNRAPDWYREVTIASTGGANIRVMADTGTGLRELAYMPQLSVISFIGMAGRWSVKSYTAGGGGLETTLTI